MDRFDRTREKTAKARALRHPLSKPEVILWSYLRGGRLGISFRKQHPIGPYFLDFYCAELALAVEVDGSQHQARQAQDATRTAFLASKGITVIRYHAVDVLSNVEGVVQHLWQEVKSRQRGAERAN